MEQVDMTMTFSSIVGRLKSDFQADDIWWQFGAIVASLLLAFMLTCWVSRLLNKNKSSLGLTHWSMTTAWPLLSCGLLWSSQVYLSHIEAHISFVGLMSVMTFSWGLINLILLVLHRTFPNVNLKGSSRTIALSIWVLAALHIFGVLHELTKRLEAITIPVGSGSLTLLGLIYALLLILVTLLFALWLGAVVDHRIMNMSKVDLSLRVVLSRLLRSLLVVFSILLGMSSAGIDLTILSVFGGALGVGLGLGFQRIASNYVSGFILLFERSVKIGDVITPAGQTPGWVTAIRTRFTVVRGFDGVETMVPNETLITSLVQTQAATTPSELVEQLSRKAATTLTFIVSHDTNVDQAMALMMSECLKHERILKDNPTPKVLLMNVSPEGLSIDITFSVPDAHKGTNDLKSMINIGVLEVFKANGIKLAQSNRMLSSS